MICPSPCVLSASNETTVDLYCADLLAPSAQPVSTLRRCMVHRGDKMHLMRGSVRFSSIYFIITCNASMTKCTVGAKVLTWT